MLCLLNEVAIQALDHLLLESFPHFVPKNNNPERAIINISDSREADMSKVNSIMPAQAGIIFPGKNLSHFPGIIFPGKIFLQKA